MSVRGCLLALAASSLVVLLTGCDNKAKAERDSLVSQNRDFKTQLEAKDAEIAKANAETAALRNAAATPATDAAGPTVPPVTDGVDLGAPTGAPRGTSRAGGPRVHTSTSTIELSADVLFDSGRSVLKASAKSALDKAVATLKSQHKGEHLIIEGHTDSTPFKKTSGMTNEKLGLARAKAVLEYLASHGITRSTMTAVSKADHEPKSKTNPALNRRVAIIASR